MKKKSKKYASLLLSVAVLASAQVFPSLEQQVKATIDSQTKNSASTAKNALSHTTTGLTSKAIEAQLAANGVKFEKLTPQEQKDVYVEVIVQLSAAPASENGSINPETASTAEIEQATNRVIAAQNSIKNQVQAITNQAIGKSYGYVVNGFSTKVKVKDIQKLRALPGVKSVTLAKVYFATDASADNMANVSTVWSNYQYKGQGTVVSIIDTGIDPNHKDLRLSDESKVKLTAKDIDAFTENSGYGRYFTSKVPFGHNYSDNNDIITDDGKEQHGMHVAGIVAANGTGKDPANSVVGVAPEAQLLAMKAFSNSDSSSTTDSTSVIGAIDDSAKLGADVLNMSLGSVSGQQTEDDPEIAAVEKAVKSGTSAVISAGNSGTSTSDQDGTNKDYYGNPDMETIGSPGTSRSATTVASAENTNVTTDGITISAAGKTIAGPVVTQLSGGTDLSAFDNKEFYLVKDKDGKLGVGTPDQYSSDVKGKIAVVARGEIAFTQKQANAQAAGAAGLIIVNNAGGNTPLTSVAYTDGFPTAGLSTEAGNKLVEYIEAHPDQALQVSIVVQPLTNVAREKDLMSDFTSYGPASNLAFKPDITAPGGNIWSLQNNNSYVNMSGTSMASPFIAGSQALLVQAMNDKTNKFYGLYQKMSNTERTAFIKNLEMNTAAIVPDVSHDSVIESPRRQGAGLVDVEAAIQALQHNPSTVSGENDYPGVELKDFNDKKHQFTLKFTNRTNKALTYSLLEDGKFADVYTSANDASATLYEKKIEGASVEANGKIVVAPNSTKQVSFTLNLPDNFALNQYVEGFLTFKGSDDSQLRIPYMGFYGDWSQPEIFDKLNGLTFDPVNKNLGTIVSAGNASGSQGYAGLYRDDSGKLRVNEKAIAFSTDPKASITWLKPQYFLFRNANNVQAKILDKDGHVINTLATLNNVTKSYWSPSAQRYHRFSYAPSWDGTYFNQQTNKTETVADGNYVYRIEGTVDGTKKTQHYDINMVVDSTKPDVRKARLVSHKDKQGKRQYFMAVEAKDDLSGLDGAANTAVNDVIANSVTYKKTGETKDGFSKLEIPLKQAQVAKLAPGKNSIAVALFDNATNAGTTSAYSQKPGSAEYSLVFANGGFPVKITSLSKNYDAVDGVYELVGNYPDQPYATYTDSQGKEHELKVEYDQADGTFRALLPVEEADYTTTVKFYTDSEHETLITTKKARVSVLPAKVESLSVDGEQTYSADSEKEPKLAQSSEDKVTLSGKVSDDTASVTVTAGGKSNKATLNADHTFSVDVPVSFGENNISVTVADSDGNKSSVKQVVKSSNRGKTEVASSDVTFNDGVKFGTMSVNDQTPNYDAKTGVLTLTGKVKRPTTTLIIGGKDVRVKSDGSFTVKLDLGKHGSKVFPVIIGDTTVSQVVQERLTFYVDANSPTLTLDAEKLEDGTYKPIYTTKDKYTISGEFTDDYAYYSLKVNGNNIASSYADVDYNSSKPYKKHFEHEVELKEGKNTFNVEGSDDNDNSTGVQTLVVYYKKAQELPAPAVTATTSSDNRSVSLNATTDQEDAHVVYSLDGKTYQDLDQKGLTVTKNGNVYFKAVDKYGNESKPVSYDVTQIKENASDSKELAQARRELRAKLDEARQLGTSGKYTHESAQNLAQARQKAAQVLRNKDAKLAELQEALQELTKAVQDLKEKQPVQPVDQNKQKVEQAKQELRKHAQKLSELDLTKYTPESTQKLSDAIKAVNAVLDNANASLTDVQAAEKQLTQAEQALVEKATVDPNLVAAKTNLKNKIAEAEKLDLTKYTEGSQKVFKSVLELAKTILANDNTNLDAVQKVTDSLDAAKKGLTEKSGTGVTPQQDPKLIKAKADLKAAVEDAQKLDLSKYTAESKAAFLKAAKAADEILVNEKAQLADLENAKSVLLAAKVGLSEKVVQPVLPPVHIDTPESNSENKKTSSSASVTSSNSHTSQANNTAKETLVNAKGYVPVLHNNPKWKVALRDQNGHLTGKYIATNTSWKIFAKKEINGKLYYRLGSQAQWVPADYIQLAQDAKGKKLNAVAYVPVLHHNKNYKVALWNSKGKLTGYIKTNSYWKVFEEKKINGRLMYRIGNDNQWVPAQYAKLKR